MGEHRGPGVLGVDDEHAAADQPGVVPVGLLGEPERGQVGVAGGECRGDVRIVHEVGGDVVDDVVRGARPDRTSVRAEKAASTPALLAWVSATSCSGDAVPHQGGSRPDPDRAVGPQVGGPDQDRRVELRTGVPRPTSARPSPRSTRGRSSRSG